MPTSPVHPAPEVMTRQSVAKSITEELMEEIEKQPRMDNFKKWVKGILCGSLSFVTCCMFCGGCCGRIIPPDALINVDVEEDYKNEYANMHPADKKAANVAMWFTLSCFSSYSIVLCCGCCCGCCGIISPSDAMKACVNANKI
jgi:hypothetical protein